MEYLDEIRRTKLNVVLQRLYLMGAPKARKYINRAESNKVYQGINHKSHPAMLGGSDVLCPTAGGEPWSEDLHRG